MMLPRIPREIQIKVYDFVKDYIEYLKQYGDNFTCNIWTMDDDEAFRDNCGWYQYDDKEHIINMNAFNLSMTSVFIQKGILDFDSFFVFITLCTRHEYRHYIQGTVNYDGKKVEGFTEKDCLANELMLYIRYFYDGYYLTNKSNVKYELDA